MPDQETAKYDPSIFYSPRSWEAALGIALTPEGTTTTADRFRKETPYFADLFDAHIKLTEESRVMDFGCGPGRMAKEIISRHKCRVYGVDISPAMLAFASAHANSPSFAAIHPDMLDEAPQFDAIIAIWVLQHIPSVEDAIKLLVRKLKPTGRVFVVNAYDQIFPIEGNRWLQNQEISVLNLMQTRMKQVAFGDALDEEKTTPAIAKHAWWGVFENRIAWASAA